MTSKKPRTRRSPKEARRLLVEAARAVLLEVEGEIEMIDVARRAGVSEGLAYYHFGNKAGLLDAIVRDFYDRLDEAVLAIPFVGDTWVEREEARTREFVRLMYEDPVASLVLNVVRTDPSVHAEETARRRRLNELGARNIAEAQRDGEIDLSHDPRTLIAMVLAGTMAGVTEALDSHPPKSLDAAQEEAWGFVLRAVGLGEGDRARSKTRRAFVVCGNAGTGKTTYGRSLAAEHGAAFFDIDSLSERLVQVGLQGQGLSPDDRDSPEYKALFRDAIHETLFVAADDNLDQLPCVIVAPFTIERRRPTFVAELQERLRAEVRVFVVHCEPDERRRRMAARGNPRDHAKLNDWERYAQSGVDPTRPPFEHTWVDTTDRHHQDRQ